MKRITLLENRGHHSRDRMVVGFTTISAISCEFESGSGEVYSIHHCVIKFASALPPPRLENLKCKVRLCKVPTGASLPWSYRSWIYNYLCNQCLSPLMLSVQISIRARCTTLYDKICQWLATGQWFSQGPPVSSTNKTDCHYKTEILLKMALNTIKQTNNKMLYHWNLPLLPVLIRLCFYFSLPWPGIVTSSSDQTLYQDQFYHHLKTDRTL